jgi:hypothetical protein
MDCPAKSENLLTSVLEQDIDISKHIVSKESLASAPYFIDLKRYLTINSRRNNEN